MQILENFPLKRLHTFGIDVLAKKFARFDTVDSLREILTTQTSSPLVLGGGSNILFTRNVDALVLKNEILGIEKIKEDEEHVWVRAGAGENWHQFVMHCIANNWAGVENLSLIPGCVGASPMQNIGAYGVEIKDVFEELEAIGLRDGKTYTFKNSDCEFGYRESVFKRKYKDQFVITSVSFKLNKQPSFQISYGAIQQELEKMQVNELSIRAISDAVINIRRSKLPDPAVIGNAGSFFKNPSIDKEQYQQLLARHNDIVGYPNEDGTVKLAAGWLIEHSGPNPGTSWKGYRVGDAGVHAKQALVLVNYGNAKGEEIYHLSQDILDSVKSKFGVQLEREVNIV